MKIIKYKIAIITHDFSGFTGSELTTLEFANYFGKQGHDVTIRAERYSQQLNPYLHRNVVFSFDRIDICDFDIVFGMHGHFTLNVPELQRLKLWRGSFISIHLSGYTPAETFHHYWSSFYSNCRIFNCEEAMRLLESGSQVNGKSYNFKNSAPRKFHNNEPSKSGNLKKLLIVSNHLASEIIEASKKLTNVGVEIKHIGMEGEYKLIEPKDIAQVDAVVTIGKTVQYSLCGMRPVYCYDHYGGPGWLRNENFKLAEYHNFSGRCNRLKKSADEIVEELLNDFSQAKRFTEENWETFSKSYDLEGFLAGLPLSKIGNEFSSEECLHQIDLMRGILIHTSWIWEDVFSKEKDGQIANLNQRVAELNGQIDELNKAKTIASITNINSWRITRPLRKARRWLSNPRQQLKRYTTFALKLAKFKLYPMTISYATKRKIYSYFATHFPSLLGFYSALRIKKYISDNQPNFTLLKEKTLGLPVVSIIIPVYGKADYSLRCIVSIAKNLPKTSFEVIVVDDCSPDDSYDVLSKVQGICLLRNDDNQGFIHSCNTGAEAARGDYLYFLNNDTEVTSGWLDELLRTFHEFPGTGLAGSKLLYPDGRLQEAGGIIWQDGSALNFGRNQDPQLPVYNYAREVDYCSGASIMVPRALFDELGGFDEYYLPAYCEDSDLALKIRDMGYRVIYQPMSTVIHFEGVTSGTDITKGTKAYQVVNMEKQYARWKHRLSRHQAPCTEVDAAKDRRATRRVLFLDHCTPTPDQDSGSIDAYNQMLLLREMGFQVTFIPETNFLYMPSYTDQLQFRGIEMLYAPYVTSVKQHVEEYGDRYDLVFISRVGAFQRNINLIRKYCPKARVLFHTVDLHFLRMERKADLLKSSEERKRAEEVRVSEIKSIKAADISTVISTEELKVLEREAPEQNIRLLPYARATHSKEKSFKERNGVVFVGGYQHAPNVDAVKYFVEEVMPMLRKKLPGVCFYAAGSKPPEEIKALAAEDIIVTEFVEDLTPFLDKMRVSVAPLRYGAGIKGKIGTAMSVGLPVVATTLAVEGMSLSDGENILVADGAEALADAVARLYQDEALWNRISENGLVFAEQAWGAEAAWKTLAEILCDLGFEAKQATYPLSLYSVPSPIDTQSTARRNILQPIASVKSRKDYMQLLASDAMKQTNQIAEHLLSKANREAFVVNGFCVPCDKTVSFLVDMQSGGQRHTKGWTPNWRERLECPFCRMNNRQRLIATLMKQALSDEHRKQVYLMEQVTPIYNWASKTFKNHKITGSEYLGYEYAGGTVVKGIRHEDAENLSFADGQIDLVVSNDVFEHVPNPAKAFAECARVLKPGGVMLATIPFHSENDSSVVRARLSKGKLDYILPPAFHGNPLSAEGSLVFTDFGFDLLDTMKEAGFSGVAIDIYASAEFGHLGGTQMVFKSTK